MGKLKEAVHSVEGNKEGRTMTSLMFETVGDVVSVGSLVALRGIEVMSRLRKLGS